MKDCNYPKCTECTLPDCEMDEKDIQAMLVRRRRRLDPEKYRQKNREYNARISANLPHCDECEMCVLVAKEKQDGYRRLCIEKMRLIEQKTANSPQWCSKRTPSRDYVKRREKILRQKREQYVSKK